MLRLTTVSHASYLPVAFAERPDALTYIFNILKEDTSYYLLDIPSNLGGINQSGHGHCWWVLKDKKVTNYEP